MKLNLVLFFVLLVACGKVDHLFHGDPSSNPPGEPLLPPGAPSVVAPAEDKEDVVVRDEVHLASWLHFTRPIGKLTFRRGSRLVSDGFPVRLVVDEIISEGGVLETFEEGQKATRGNAGRSGGIIVLEAARASGDLRVILRGEGGGDGRNGNAGQPGGPGANAPDILLKSIVVFNGQQAPPLERGRDGSPGNPGENGQDSGAGGSAGSIHVSIKEHSQFNISFEEMPGAGGDPGAGGIGGPGGAGGLGGTYYVIVDGVRRNYGDRAPNGTAGPSGAHGGTGRTGAPGGQANVCSFAKELHIGDCERVRILAESISENEVYPQYETRETKLEKP
jgi:hypothetical protein